MAFFVVLGEGREAAGERGVGQGRESSHGIRAGVELRHNNYILFLLNGKIWFYAFSVNGIGFYGSGDSAWFVPGKIGEFRGNFGNKRNLKHRINSIGIGFEWNEARGEFAASTIVYRLTCAAPTQFPL